MLDKLNRKIDYLRISVIDRCNLRCVYCMPEEGVESIPHEEILTYDEILRICETVSQLGIKKIKITEFLQWNDRNGCYTDENCDLEDIPRMTYEDAVKYFFGVMNDDFYYSITDNIFKLSYEEVIKYAKDNNFYDSTYEKLNLLINNDKPTIEFYKSLI